MARTEEQRGYLGRWVKTQSDRCIFVARLDHLRIQLLVASTLRERPDAASSWSHCQQFRRGEKDQTTTRRAEHTRSGLQGENLIMFDDVRIKREAGPVEDCRRPPGRPPRPSIQEERQCELASLKARLQTHLYLLPQTLQEVALQVELFSFLGARIPVESECDEVCRCARVQDSLRPQNKAPAQMRSRETLLLFSLFC